MLNNLSEPFGTSRGLFNIALAKVVRDSRIETKGTIYNKTVQILAYADDIVLVGRPTGVPTEAIINLSKAAKEMGLTINQ
jgi:hypothetical protein